VNYLPLKLVCLFLFVAQSCQEVYPEIVEIENPSKMSSAESNLVVAQNGALYLSWIEEDDSYSNLYLSQYKEDKFAWARRIASGENWFVNWADFPGIAAFNQEGHLLSYWLEMKGQGTYDYDIKYSMSSNHGQSWSTPRILHNDGVAAEHGFVSAVPYEDKLLIVWLDGRSMGSGHGDAGHNHGHGNGSMMLRSAMVDIAGDVSNRLMIDDRVCECCQTDITISPCGAFVVYRDRSPDEIRDTYYAQYTGKEWSEPKPLYQDKWKINGCPVNGPQIDNNNGIIAAAWYSESNNLRKVQLSISNDCGNTFSDPFILSEGEKAMGRLDLKVSYKGTIYISYMEESIDTADIIICAVNKDGKILNRTIVGQNVKSRKSGFPRLAVHKEQVYICYPDRLESKRIKVKQLI